MRRLVSSPGDTQQQFPPVLWDVRCQKKHSVLVGRRARGLIDRPAPSWIADAGNRHVGARDGFPGLGIDNMTLYSYAWRWW
jgi:hypothetical protein